MKAIILAAGIGLRLGNSNPKPLTKNDMKNMYQRSMSGDLF